jgi:hypothetical protein
MAYFMNFIHCYILFVKNAPLCMKHNDKLTLEIFIACILADKITWI